MSRVSYDNYLNLKFTSVQKLYWGREMWLSTYMSIACFRNSDPNPEPFVMVLSFKWFRKDRVLHLLSLATLLALQCSPAIPKWVQFS